MPSITCGKLSFILRRTLRNINNPQQPLRLDAFERLGLWAQEEPFRGKPRHEFENFSPFQRTRAVAGRFLAAARASFALTVLIFSIG